MKKLTSILIMAVLIFVAISILVDSESILRSVEFSLNIFKENIFPSLFPFFVLSNILVKCGFVELLGTLFKGIMGRMFRIKGAAAFVFIMSIISGNPANAKYTKELLDNGTLNKGEATKILCFTCFSNPLFILGTVSLTFLNNKEAGILILICHYLGNIIIGVMMRNYCPSEDGGKVSFREAIDKMHNKRISNNENLGVILTNSLTTSINTLLLVLGVITTFLVITTIISETISLNSVMQSTLNGFIEMTQGLKYISMEAIPLKLKCVLAVMMLSFGGLSVHMQIMSILSDAKIKYLPFLCARVMHSLISGMMVYLLFDFWF